MREPFNIVVSGEGGQGVLSIAKVVAAAAWLQGKQAVYLPSFSTEKRGGISTAFARIGDDPIRFPRFQKADMGVALSQRALERVRRYLKDDAVVIVNSFLVKDVASVSAWRPHLVDATSVANARLKKPRTFNMVIMGAMVRFIPGLTVGGFDKALEKQFASKYAKDPALKELNHEAFGIGYELAA